MNRTIRHVFPHVRAFRDGPHKPGGAPITNIVFFASLKPIQFGPRVGPFDSDTCRDVLNEFRGWETLRTVAPDAPLITNAHNSLGRLALPVAEAFRESMNKLYPSEL